MSYNNYKDDLNLLKLLSSIIFSLSTYQAREVLILMDLLEPLGYFKNNFNQDLIDLITFVTNPKYPAQSQTIKEKLAILSASKVSNKDTYNALGAQNLNVIDKPQETKKVNMTIAKLFEDIMKKQLTLISEVGYYLMVNC